MRNCPGIILHGGVAVDGEGDEFLVRQQRFKERAQAVLVRPTSWRSVALIPARC